MNDERFAAKAIELGYTTPERIAESKAERGGNEPIHETLLRKGFLTQDQILEVRRELGEDPDMIPGYEILGTLGKGGMGIVFRARQKSMGRIVALKVMLKDFSKDKTHVERFLREARSAAKLAHPNLVAAYDTGEAEGRYYLAMELVEGTTLRKLIQARKRLDEPFALRVGRDIATALQVIHAAGLVHRDVKPENIMIGKDPAAKLCDFGLARPTGTSDNSLTATGFALGTPLYCSPEQARGDKTLDVRSDIYSLGATLYHALTGRPPFVGDNAATICFQHLSKEPALPRTLNPSISEAAQAVVMKMLRKKASDRYQTPAELRADLEAVLSGDKPKTHRATIRRARPAQRSYAPFVFGGIVVAIVIAVVVLVTSSPTKPPPRPRPAPPDETAQKSPPTPDPVVPDPREAEASNLFAEAALAYKDKQFETARGKLDTLQSRFAAVALVREKMSEISSMLADCKVQLGRRRDAANAAYDEALDLQRKGDWMRAKEKFLALASQGVETERATKESMASGIRSCETELACKADLEALKAKIDGKQWREAAAFIDSLLANPREAATLAAARPELEALKARCAREIAAQAVLFRARGDITNKAWEQALAAIVELQAYGDTATVRDGEPEINELKSQAQKQIEVLNKDALQAAWDHAFRQVKAKDWKKARECLVNMRAYYGETEFFKKREAEWKTEMDRVEAELRREEDGRADTIWKAAQTHVREKRFDSALELLTQLVRDYSETAWFKKNVIMVNKAVKECQAKAKPAAGPTKFLADFEDGLGTWDPDMGGNVARPAVSEASPGYESKKAARVKFTRAGSPGAWASIFLKTGALDRDAVGIRFWARSGTDAPVTVRFAVVEWPGPGGGKEVLVAPFTVGPKWEQITMEFKSLKASWGPGGNGKVDPDRAGGVGFDMGDGKADIDLIVDRFEMIEEKK